MSVSHAVAAEHALAWHILHRHSSQCWSQYACSVAKEGIPNVLKLRKEIGDVVDDCLQALLDILALRKPCGSVILINESVGRYPHTL